MIGRDGRRAAGISLPALVILSGLFASCAPPSGLVLTDPALAVVDPEGARAYSSFRAARVRWTAREHPAGTQGSALEEFADSPPGYVLLSPLLASEYPAVRAAFPEALVLGTGLPSGGRTVSASWDPAPAAREAGARAGAFLRDRGGGLPEPPEAVILSSGDSQGGREAAEAFREGLLAVLPDVPVRMVDLPGGSGAEEAAAVVRGLAGPGAKAVFLDSGSAGFRAARSLAGSSAPGGETRGPRLSILRSVLPPTPGVPADLLLLRDSRNLLRAFRKALEEGESGPIAVPETLETPPRRSAGP